MSGLPADGAPTPFPDSPRFDVVLVCPEIATNTGNIIRLCANTGARLHLVEPLGFSMDSALLRRAGLDYHELATVVIHPTLRDCLAGLRGRRLFALSSRSTATYDTIDYHDGDVFVFGAERGGLTSEQFAELAAAQALAIPMRPANRSLNLANAVAVVVYEAWRQSGFAGAGDGSAATVAETTTSEPFDVRPIDAPPFSESSQETLRS